MEDSEGIFHWCQFTATKMGWKLFCGARDGSKPERLSLTEALMLHSYTLLNDIINKQIEHELKLSMELAL